MTIAPTPTGLRAFELHFVVLCCALLFVSLVSSIVDVEQYFSGQYFNPSFTVHSPLRLLRDGIYLVVILEFVYCALTNPTHLALSWLSLLTVSGVCLLALCAATFSFFIDLPLIVIASGFRFFEYVPLALISAYVYRACGARPFKIIGRAAFLYLLIETILGAVETRFHFVTPWGRTFIGSRAFGTFSLPDIFGSAMVFTYLLVRVSVSSFWRIAALTLVLFDVFASGSRAAILDLAFVEGMFSLASIKFAWDRIVAILAASCTTPIIILLVTSKQVTGRDTGFGTAGFNVRFGVWKKLLDHVHSASDLLMGWGVGLGSNTAFSIGYETQRGVYIADNTLFFLLGSYGIMGVILCLCVLSVVTWKLRDDTIGLAMSATFFLQLMVGQVMETYPLNELAMLMFGWRLAAVQIRNSGTCVESRRAENPA